MATESGYSNEKAYGRSRHKIIQSLGSNKNGEAVAQLCLFSLPAGIEVPLAITAVAYADIEKKTLLLTLSAVHNARQWDVVRFLDGNLFGYELEILSCPNTNQIIIHNLRSTESGVEILPAIADEVTAMRWVTARGGIDGGFAVSILGVATEAKQDEQIALMKPESKGFAKIDDLSTVTELAYTELLADTGADEITKIQIMMTNGQPLYLAFGAAAAEVDKLIIIPGGNGPLDLQIPPNTRLSVKNIYTPVAQTGQLFMNLLGPA